MPIDVRGIGLRLRLYREQLQLSLNEVSAATGIDEIILSGIESGAEIPSGDDILILSDHYKCDYKFFISDEKKSPYEQVDILYRAHGRDFSKKDRLAIQEFLYLCENEEFLMRECGTITKPFSFPAKGTYYKRHGEEGAAEFRNHLGYADNVVPRDVYGDFRKCGVHVFRRKLESSSISGLFIHHPTAGKCALINYNEDFYRQRFSAAHEMAHAIFDADQKASVSYLVQTNHDLKEVRANTFASCYLMPPQFLGKLENPSEWDRWQVIHWAHELRVSCDALGLALKAASLIDSEKCAFIRKQKVPSSKKVDPELPENLSPLQFRRKSELLERGLSDFMLDCALIRCRREL